jgi:hypothetical protein
MPTIPFHFGRKKDKDDERRAKLVEKSNAALERGLDLIARCDDVQGTTGRPEKVELADMVARALNGEPMLGYEDDMALLDESEPEDVSDVEESDDDENADQGEDIVDLSDDEEPAKKDD